MNIKDIITENKSVSTSLIEAANNAIKNAGYNAYFDNQGNLNYVDQESSESQDEIYKAYSEDCDVQTIVDDTRL